MSAFPMACNIAHARNVKTANLAHRAELRTKEDIILKLQNFSIQKLGHLKPHDSFIVHLAANKHDASMAPTNAAVATPITSPTSLVSTTTVPMIELTANFKNVIEHLKNINTDKLIRETIDSNHN